MEFLSPHSKEMHSLLPGSPLLAICRRSPRAGLDANGLLYLAHQLMRCCREIFLEGNDVIPTTNASEIDVRQCRLGSQNGTNKIGSS